MKPGVLQVTRPSTRWGVAEAFADLSGLVFAVGAFLLTIFLIGTPIALAIVLVLRLVGMARGGAF